MPKMEKLSHQQTQKKHGIPGILLCGIPTEHLETVVSFCKINFPQFPFKIATAINLEQNLLTIFKNLDSQIPEKNDYMPPSIIFSGFSPADINHFIDLYRTLDIPAPLWGSRTINTDFWTLRQLLKNYIAEYQTLSSQKNNS